MGRLLSRFLFLFMVSLFSEHSCLQWSQEHELADDIYVCSDGILTLPWNITVNPGDTVLEIQWMFFGRSAEVIAVFSKDNFQPMPSYAKRVWPTTNAGIGLDDVTAADDGNYSVEIKGRESGSDTIKSLNASVVVHVVDGLQTVDKLLHVNMTQAAEYNTTTNQYHVVLSCGTFTYPAQPPFEAAWLTPSGHVLNSSRYQDGNFYLALSNPVEVGLYTCRVPAASACLRSKKAAVASVNVDTVEARLAVLEARTTLLAQRVSFCAQLSEDFCAGGVSGCTADVPLVLPKVVTNVGNGYDPTTGRFVAPVTGVYCFMASTETSYQSDYAAIELYTSNGTRIGYVPMKNDDHYGTGSIHAITHLTVGEGVHLNAYGGLYAPATAFSGFLIAADP